MARIGPIEITRNQARHVATGFAMAGALVPILFIADTGQLAPLVRKVGGDLTAAALLWLAFGAIFAGLRCLIARIGDDDDDDGPHGGGGHRRMQGEPIPIRVDARRDRR